MPFAIPCMGPWKLFSPDPRRNCWDEWTKKGKLKMHPLALGMQTNGQQFWFTTQTLLIHVLSLKTYALTTSKALRLEIVRKPVATSPMFGPSQLPHFFSPIRVTWYGNHVCTLQLRRYDPFSYNSQIHHPLNEFQFVMVTPTIFVG